LKMKPIEGSETSAFRTQTPGNYPKENILRKEHGESLKSRNQVPFLASCSVTLGRCTFPNASDRISQKKKNIYICSSAYFYGCRPAYVRTYIHTYIHTQRLNFSCLFPVWKRSFPFHRDGILVLLLMTEISSLMQYPFFFLSLFLPATKFRINKAALVLPPLYALLVWFLPLPAC